MLGCWEWSVVTPSARRVTASPRLVLAGALVKVAAVGDPRADLGVRDRRACDLE
ncbi:hypothetical protein Ae706Ps2_6082c [Pseudonocardia sp. Ae706_Ps2]|nr:hypothetical protein Ae706Ps2_6072c [Pseudonocardia sp. Ae706_Ps2]OLM09620.1 hypothetical protein Ae706Ps2_6082c [Pseudonocardia sp. Ae706_Ps2]